MTRRDRKAKLARAQAHGPDQRQKLKAAHRESKAAAKASKKGKAGVLSQMRKRGYDLVEQRRVTWDKAKRKQVVVRIEKWVKLPARENA